MLFRLSSSKKQEEPEDEEPTCHKCGYLLHGLTSNICPECGTPFDLSLCPKCRGSGEVQAVRIWHCLLLLVWVGGFWWMGPEHVLKSNKAVKGIVMFLLSHVLLVGALYWRIFRGGREVCRKCRGDGRRP